MQPTEIASDRRLDADQLVRTETERLALTRLREVTSQTNGPMERHGLRVFLICERMAADRALAVDREVLLVAGLLHDIGLYEEASRGGVYVSDGREFTARLLSGRPGWEEGRTRLCLDAIERHHELRSQWSAGAEVELIRRADIVELTACQVRFGLDRGWLRRLIYAVPRKGIYREVGRMLAKAVRERPASLPRIFIRGR